VWKIEVGSWKIEVGRLCSRFNLQSVSVIRQLTETETETDRKAIQSKIYTKPDRMPYHSIKKVNAYKISNTSLTFVE
jgi:glutaminase